jgi:hypothetical protein
MFPTVFGAMDHEQTGGVATFSGLLGDEVGGQVEIEKIGAKRHGERVTGTRVGEDESGVRTCESKDGNRWGERNKQERRDGGT